MSARFKNREMAQRLPEARAKRWDLDQTLLQLGERDGISIKDLLENALILGGVGSGKTSGSGNAICYAILKAGFGGIVFTAKRGEAERFEKLCRKAGRLDDLIVINDQSDFQFNFLDYQLKLQGQSSGLIENIVAALDATVKVAERATGAKQSRGQEQFWEQGIRKHSRSIITLIIYATGGISVSHMLELMRELPRELAQANNQDWLNDSLVMQLLTIARHRNSDPIALHDLDQVEAYFLQEFPSIAERTRSVFEAGLYGILDLLSRGTLYAMFGRETNITPAVCLEGKILVIDLPVATHRAVGLIAQTLFKLAFQQTAECRTDEDSRPLFSLSDEFQELITVEDFRFASISRECRVANIWLTQSVASLYTVLGGDESGKAACDTLLGLASLKIFHSNSCPICNDWAAELIGRRRVRMHSSSVNHVPYRLFAASEDEARVSTSISESFEFAVMPHEFASLRKGGAPHMETDTIVFRGGGKWLASNESYLRVTFSQEIR